MDFICRTIGQVQTRSLQVPEEGQGSLGDHMGDAKNCGSELAPDNNLLRTWLLRAGSEQCALTAIIGHGSCQTCSNSTSSKLCSPYQCSTSTRATTSTMMFNIYVRLVEQSRTGLKNILRWRRWPARKAAPMPRKAEETSSSWGQLRTSASAPRSCCRKHGKIAVCP